MAAISLKGATVSGDAYTQTSVGTTWQEYTLADWCRKYTVIGENAAVYVAVDAMGAGAETPADGGAVGTHRTPIASATPAEFVRKEHSSREASQSIFVAAQAGTATVTVIQET